jgi:hypothetical protein
MKFEDIHFESASLEGDTLQTQSTQIGKIFYYDQ